MSTTKISIATGMCCDTEERESVYGQVVGRSSSTQFQAVYWRCVVLHFASSVRNNPTARHLLFTNAKEVPKLGEFDTAQFLSKLGVKIVHVPFTYVPPQGFFGAWSSTFYKFDIIKYFAETCSDDELCISLDSDCIWVGSADRLASDLERDGLVNYDLELTETEDINGWSRCDLRTAYAELGVDTQGSIPNYYGAELIAADGKQIKRLFAEIDAIWQTSLEQFKAGKPKFNTEEQMLSYAYQKLGYVNGVAKPYLKRVWTSPTFYKACSEDLTLDIWHMPSEKMYGIKRLFKQACQPTSRFWSVSIGQPFVEYAAQYLGVPKKTLAKTFLDAIDDRKAGLLKRVTHVKKIF